jgi:predicted MFS family arabinose efflux permease
MSIFNLGTQGSQVVGGYLYDILGYVPLIFISAAATAATWLLVPLVKVERIEAKARAETAAVATTA